jgi:replicative DNA helicase
MGKTALALQIAVNVAMVGHAVGFFSLEMTDDQLALRAMCATANVEYNRAVAGRLSREEWSLLVDAQRRVHNMPIHIDDTPALKITEIGRRSRRWKRLHNIELLVLDHIQLARGDNRKDRYLMVTEVSAGLKAIAKELHIPVLALCQLNREVEKRTDKRPLLSDLRESGAIEQDADIVLGVYRHASYKPDEADPNEAQICILKQRNGRVGIVKIGWNGQAMRFYNPT